MRRLLIFLGVVPLIVVDCGWCQSAARQAGYLYLSPVPQASYESAQTRFVLVRFENIDPSAVTNLESDFFKVVGARSGLHSGTARVASDGRTVIFQMNSDFSMNELVTVYLTPELAAGEAGNVGPFSYQFMITAPMPGSLPLAGLRSQGPAKTQATTGSDQPERSRATRSTSQHPPRPKAMLLSNGVSVPSDFPKSVITVNANPSPGYLFLENALDGVPPYSMILDNNGLPVWYHTGRLFDFKIQKNGLITWGEFDDTGLATYSGFDQNFNFVRNYGTTNGYVTDGHDLKVEPDGSYYIIAYQTNAVNLSLYIAGAPTYAIVTETAVQGFTAANDFVFQWRSWDNYDLRDLVPTANTDLAHMNGIDIDDDGNILVSARHLSEVTKIDRDSGDIIWRLSGAHSSFTFVNDPLGGTSYQHNISALGKGHYMVFDNGDYHSPMVSRAVEYQLNLTNKTATMVWQFRDKPDKYTFWLGSAQRLPTGNTLIDFVQANYPKAIEVNSNGVKQFELSLVPGSESYRAFRFPWNGVAAAPYLVVEPQPNNLTLVFNKFCDTNVAYYRIYGGTSPQPTAIMAEANTTIQKLSSLENGTYYFRVTSVGTDGVESPFSNEEEVLVNLTAPNQNMVQNGDFSNGTASWLCLSNGTASADWVVEGGASYFYIGDGGTSLAGIQLVQEGLAFIRGEQYVLEFDAWADQSRYIQAQVMESVFPFIDYSGLSATFLTPNRTHYRYTFTMQQPSDFSAQLVFNLGGAAGTLYLANISVVAVVPGDLNLDYHVDVQDLSILCGNWLKRQTGLAGDIDGNGTVNFNDFSLLGQNWGTGVP